MAGGLSGASEITFYTAFLSPLLEAVYHGG